MIRSGTQCDDDDEEDDAILYSISSTCIGCSWLRV